MTRRSAKSRVVWAKTSAISARDRTAVDLVRSTLRLVRTSPHHVIAHCLRESPQRSIVHALVRAFTAGEREIVAALDALTRHFSDAHPAGAYIADSLVALALRGGQSARARAIINTVADVPADLASLYHAHRAILHALDGQEDAAFGAIALAEADDVDDLTAGLIKERLGRAYYVLERYDAACKRALSAVLHFERVGANVMAAQALRTPTRIEALVRGDISAVREHGARALALLLDSGFHVLALDLRARLLLFAAEMGDDDEFLRLDSATTTTAFTAILARAVFALGKGNVSSAVRHLAPAQVVELRPMERILYTTLRAVCDALLESAGQGAVQAVDAVVVLTDRPIDSTERRFAALARALAVGLALRLQRVDDARALAERLGGTLEEGLAEYALGKAPAVPTSLAGYVPVFDLLRRQAVLQVQLTAAERRLLALLAEGVDVARIANQLQRSAGTVRTHLEHLRDKLGVCRSEDLAQRAHDLGLVG